MIVPEKIIIGTRASRLAVIQSNELAGYLKENFPETEVTLLPMKTTGDKILDRSLDKIGGKGLFVKELDLALLEGRTDLSVHSLKDMPLEVFCKLPVIAYSKREDARDVLVLPEGASQINFDKPIGVSSLRRMIQLKEIYPDAQFTGIRGNVPTRIEKLDSGLYGALVLAAAGLKRLGLEGRISRYFDTDEIIPCAGQGILAVQGRAGADYSYLEGFDDKDSRAAALAERSFTAALGGGCSSPTAAYAQISEGKMTLKGLYYSEKEKRFVTGFIKGSVRDASKLGEKLVSELKEKMSRKES